MIKKYSDCNLPKFTLEELKENIFNLPTGSTIFVHGNSFYAKVIREGINSFWNHSATVFWINGELYIVDARWGHEVYPILFEDWLIGREDSIFGIAERHVEDRKITKHFGKKYDRWSVLICFPIEKYTGIWLGKKDARAAEMVFCMELTALIAGIERYYDAIPDRLVK